MGRRVTATPPPELVVRGGTLVTDGWRGAADIFVAEGRVVALAAPGTPLPPGSAGATEVDATQRLVMPGGVDPHCHVGFTSGGYTSLDDYREATTAAIFGGTTTIVDFAIPRPGERPADVADRQRALAAGGLCDSALHASVTAWDDTIPEQLHELTGSGIVTVKMFTTYRGESMADEDTILRVMKHLSTAGGMAVVHCEANHIIEDVQASCAAHDRIAAEYHHLTRPALAETASVAEIIAIAESLGTRVYVVHQSTPEAVDLTAAARRRGVEAYSEAVTHHLTLDDGAYAGDHPERFVCCPPLRPAAVVERLGTRLAAGAINTVGSDHCCYDTAQKTRIASDVRKMPNGLPGVETRLTVLFDAYVRSGAISLQRFVDVTATNPAKLNGLYPRKGTLLPGADADIVLWDQMDSTVLTASSLHMATDYTPYEGRRITGRPATVIVRGRPVVHDGELVDDRPLGAHVQAGAVLPV